MPNALILGATSDMAVAIAHKFASEGYSLSLAARKVEHLKPIQSDLHIRHQVKVGVYAFDAADFASHQTFTQNLSQRPDVAVCVFGYLGEQPKAQTDWQEAQRIIDTNYTGAVSVLNLLANEMEQRGSGTIVGISSVAGDRGRMSNYLYGSAKAGFTTYLNGMRNRLAHSGVHVVTVKPGFVQTKMTESLDLPKPLTAQPKEVANDVYKAFKKQKNTIYTKWFWRWIMLIIKTVPEPIFKKMKM